MLRDQGKGGTAGAAWCLLNNPPSPPPTVSPGRAWATWKDWTQRSWRSSGVTRDPGSNCPGTCGRCCLPSLLHCHPPLPGPSVFALGSVYISPPGSTRGQRREGGPWTPGPAGSGQEGLGDRACSGSDLAPASPAPLLSSRATPATRATPGRLASRVRRWGRGPLGRVLRWRLWGGVSPLSHPTPIHPALTHGLARGEGNASSCRVGSGPELDRLTALRVRHRGAPLPRSGLPWEECVGSEPPPTRPSLAIRA